MGVAGFRCFVADKKVRNRGGQSLKQLELCAVAAGLHPGCLLIHEGFGSLVDNMAIDFGVKQALC